MALNDVEEDLPYTMGRLIAGARKKKNISLEELSQGVMSAEDLNFIEKDDEYADKTTWIFCWDVLEFRLLSMSAMWSRKSMICLRRAKRCVRLAIRL